MIGSGDRLAADLVLDAHARLGEGPVWDAARSVLWWVDIVAGQVHRFDPSSGADIAFDVGSSVGCVALRHDGSVIAALADRLVTLDPESGSTETLVQLPRTELPLRCNDGKCDPGGRLWLGRMAPTEEPGRGLLLRVDQDRSITPVLVGLTVPNGLGWSADGRSMYFVDSAWGEVRRYPYNVLAGAMGEGTSFARIGGDTGVPDGLTLDAEGHLWVAVWGAGRVVRIAPDGSPRGWIDIPVSLVSSCTFGGDDLGDLYVTTASENGGAETSVGEAHAGGLFRCRPGVRGLQPAPFAG